MNNKKNNLYIGKTYKYLGVYYRINFIHPDGSVTIENKTSGGYEYPTKQEIETLEKYGEKIEPG